jgi:ComF family protein
MADFKFHGRPELAGPLSALLLQAWQDSAGDAPKPDLILPVPLSPARLAERGYNQAWELARRLASALGRPAIASGLVRVVETERQAELTREERLKNLRAAFMVEPGLRSRLAGAHLALVDDVMTTGATAREVVATLLRAGAGRVDLWVVARTPAP